MDAEAEHVIEGDGEADVEHVVAGVVGAHGDAGAGLGVVEHGVVDLARVHDGFLSHDALKDENVAVAHVQAHPEQPGRHAGAEAHLVPAHQLNGIGRIGDGRRLIEAASVHLEHLIEQRQGRPAAHAPGVGPIFGLHDGGQGLRIPSGQGCREILGADENMVIRGPLLVYEVYLGVDSESA